MKKIFTAAALASTLAMASVAQAYTDISKPYNPEGGQENLVFEVEPKAEPLLVETTSSSGPIYNPIRELLIKNDTLGITEQDPVLKQGCDSLAAQTAQVPIVRLAPEFLYSTLMCNASGHESFQSFSVEMNDDKSKSYLDSYVEEINKQGCDAIAEAMVDGKSEEGAKTTHNICHATGHPSFKQIMP